MTLDFEFKQRIERIIKDCDYKVEWFRDALIKEQEKAQRRYEHIQKLEGKILLQRLTLFSLCCIIIAILTW